MGKVKELDVNDILNDTVKDISERLVSFELEVDSILQTAKDNIMDELHASIKRSLDNA